MDHELPYYPYSTYLKNKYGEKVYNRNGKVKGDGN